MLYQKLIESTTITRDIPTRNLRAHSHGLDCLYIEIACQKNANSTRFLKQLYETRVSAHLIFCHNSIFQFIFNLKIKKLQ